MFKAMKVLAIAALIVTIAGAGAVLYGVNTMTPEVVSASFSATPATQAQQVFDQTMDQVRRGTFTGSFGEESMPERAEECTFLTYSVRLKNKGFFPAEWISMRVQLAQGDVLALDNTQPNVLPAGGEGDITATILHKGDASNAARTAEIVCHVFGKTIAFSVSIQ